MGARPINATVGSLLGFLHDGPQSGWDLVTTALRYETAVLDWFDHLPHDLAAPQRQAATRSS